VASLATVRCTLGGLIFGYALAVIVLSLLLPMIYGFGYVLLAGVLAIVASALIRRTDLQSDQAVDVVLGLGFAFLVVHSNMQLLT
jgi:hypothetical protein